MKKFSDYIQSKNLRIVLVVFGLFVLAVFIFIAGVLVGSDKANYSHRLGEQYYRDFVGGKPRFMGDRGYMNAHGASGTITSVDANAKKLVIKDVDGDVQKNIILNDQTQIVKDNQTISINDLKTGDNIIILGAPNDQGDITAKLIRVVPQLPYAPGKSGGLGQGI